MPSLETLLDQLYQHQQPQPILHKLTHLQQHDPALYTALSQQVKASLVLEPESGISLPKLLTLQSVCQLDSTTDVNLFKCSTVYALVAVCRGYGGRDLDIRGHFARNARKTSIFWGTAGIEAVYNALVNQATPTLGRLADVGARGYLWGFVGENPDMLPSGYDVYQYALKHMLMLRPDRKQEQSVFNLILQLFMAYPFNQQTLSRHFRFALQFFRSALSQKQLAGLQPTIAVLQIVKGYQNRQLDAIFGAGCLGLSWPDARVVNCISNVIKLGINESSFRLLGAFVKMFKNCNKFNELIMAYEKNIQKVFVFLKFPQLYPASLKTLRLFILGPWPVTSLYNTFAPKAVEFSKLKSMAEHRDFILLLACVVDKYRDATLVADLEAVVKDNTKENEITSQAVQQLRKQYEWRVFAKGEAPAVDNNQAAVEARGIVNIGNSCYMNSFLQGLFMTRAYRNKILQTSTLSAQKQVLAKLQALHQQPGPKSNLPLMARETVRPLAEIQHFFALLLRSRRQSISPQNIRKISPPEFQNCYQHDSIQFGRFILESLSRSIENVFQGQMTTEIECPYCSAARSRQQEFMDLMISNRHGTEGKAEDKQQIRQDISDMVRLSLEDEHIENLTCELCKNTEDSQSSQMVNEATQKKSVKKHSITKFPNYLILTLKRFKYNIKEQKNTKQAYKISLHPQFQVSTKLYLLYCLIIHRGVSANSGHYYAFAKASYDPAVNEWLCLNDATVTTLSDFAKVVDFLQSNPQDTPYILFGVEKEYLQANWKQLQQPVKLRPPLQSFLEKDNSQYAKQLSNSQLRLDFSQLRNFRGVPYPRRDDQDEPHPGMGGFGNNPIM